MKTAIEYPYLPEGKVIDYTTAEDPFMLEAKLARETLAGDSLFPVGIALVKDGKVLAKGGNGFSKGSSEVHVCPRVVLECPSGTGYELCTLHDAPGHAEVMAVASAKEQGIDLTGADAYMYGHWWACEPCWKVLIDAGVDRLFVLDDAHERFSRDAVFAETLKTDLSSAYISGALTGLPGHEVESFKVLYEELAGVCADLEIDAHVPHLHSDPDKHAHLPAKDVFELDMRLVGELDVLIAEVTHPSHGVGGELVQAFVSQKPIVLLSKKGTKISRFVTGNSAVVYHIEYESVDEAKKMLRNVLRQL